MPSHIPSEAAYHRDPYRREIEVWVDDMGVDDRHGPFLLFSETICHPHGGGQKGDRGLLQLGDEVAAALGCAAELAIVDTRKDGRGNLHILGAALDEEAAREHLIGARRFRFSLDWAFRHRQMRLHGAAHLLHCFVERVLGRPVAYPKTSDLQPDHGLNRYEERGLLSEAQAVAVAGQMNVFTAEGHQVGTFPDAEQEGFRYWRCAEWTIPCGGTHVKNTSEIGDVAVALSLKRGRTSLTFTLADQGG